MAMASDLSSGSLHARDIQVMFSGCGRLAKVCVHTTPKYRTPRMPSSVKPRLKLYPIMCSKMPAMTVSPRLLL